MTKRHFMSNIWANITLQRDVMCIGKYPTPQLLRHVLHTGNSCPLFVLLVAGTAKHGKLNNRTLLQVGHVHI